VEVIYLNFLYLNVQIEFQELESGFKSEENSKLTENPINSYNILKEITEDLADVHLKQGKGVLACAMLLSIKDIEGAVMKLLRSNEIFYAFVLSQLFDVTCNDEIMIKLSDNASLLEEKRYARFFLGKIKKNIEKKQILLENCGITLKEMDQGLKKLEDYKNLAKEALSKFNDFGAIFNNILGKNQEDSFKIAINFASSDKNSYIFIIK